MRLGAIHTTALSCVLAGLETYSTYTTVPLIVSHQLARDRHTNGAFSCRGGPSVGAGVITEGEEGKVHPSPKR